MNENLIGITERGDAALDLTWKKWVFEQHRPALLISKDPSKLYDEINDMTNEFGFKPNVIVHCTITGLGGTKIEPGVPSLKTSLEGYAKFVDLFGKDRVVLRCDPLIPIEKFVMHAVNHVMTKNLGTRIRLSFMDMYSHVKQRFTDAGIDVTKFGYDDNLHMQLENRKKFIELITHHVDPDLISACGEPGIASEPCVSKRDCEILGVTYMVSTFAQRYACHCAANKTELLNSKGRCKHGCLYCYWKDPKDYFLKK